MAYRERYFSPSESEKYTLERRARDETNPRERRVLEDRLHDVNRRMDYDDKANGREDMRRRDK